MTKSITLILSFVVAFAITASAQIADGSFEAGAGGGDWTEASTNFGTPICDAVNCGTCGGPCLPNTGTYYVWLGGANAVETASVSQSVFFEKATEAYLKMMIYIPEPGPGLAADKLEISIDGNVVKTITALDSLAYGAGYTLDSTDVSAYADSTSHTVKIEGFQTTATVTNFLVDDVELVLSGVTSVLFPEETAEEGFFMYPNHADNFVNLEFRGITGDATVRITTLSGAVVSQKTINNVDGRTFKYDTSNFESGVYLVNISNKNGMTTKKLVIMH